jgi:hypothetical protein
MNQGSSPKMENKFFIPHRAKTDSVAHPTTDDSFVRNWPEIYSLFGKVVNFLHQCNIITKDF